MMGRYHLTTMYTDSSRPNTPKHAKNSSPAAAAGTSDQLPPTSHRKPAQHQGQAMAPGGTGGAPSCRDATARARGAEGKQKQIKSAVVRRKSGRAQGSRGAEEKEN
jgi:hypothetical protein